MENVLSTTLRPAAERQVEGLLAERFDQIVREHQRRVYRVIFLLVRDLDAADTLTQECFLRAYRGLAGFRGECKIETWLLRIAVNLARDHVKNRRTTFWRRLVGFEEGESEQSAAFPFASGEPSAERALLAHEELGAVWSATSLLSPQQRSVFLLRFAEEMSLAEIADLLQVEVGTVKAQLFRATSKIREIVREQP